MLRKRGKKLPPFLFGAEDNAAKDAKLRIKAGNALMLQLSMICVVWPRCRYCLFLFVWIPNCMFTKK